jgi:LmbE family N-acetylglucosaminyl deacetylase
MNMEPNRLLAMAAASGKVGMVFFVGKRLMDWQLSVKASKSPQHATEWLASLIRARQPHVIVTEKIETAKSKGDHTKLLIAAMAALAAEHELLDITIDRPSHFANKYDEADVLAERYPEMAAWKPKHRRFFDNEPRNTVLFEALALADAVLERQS